MSWASASSTMAPWSTRRVRRPFFHPRAIFVEMLTLACSPSPPPQLESTGPRARAWCVLIHAEASVSLHLALSTLRHPTAPTARLTADLPLTLRVAPPPSYFGCHSAGEVEGARRRPLHVVGPADIAHAMSSNTSRPQFLEVNASYDVASREQRLPGRITWEPAAHLTHAAAAAHVAHLAAVGPSR
jgi:hypothetical protein